MKEQWLQIKDFEGFYEVSNLGNVRSVKRNVFVNKGKGFYRNLLGQLLKPSLDHHGYLVVGLTNNEYKKTFFVHRLVLEAFVHNEDPENKTITNHIDEDKTNNHVNNLEWCDHQYNNTYGGRLEKAARKTRKEVVGIHTETGEKFRFESTVASEKEGFRSQSVARAARGDRKTYKDIKWEYV